MFLALAILTGCGLIAWAVHQLTWAVKALIAAIHVHSVALWNPTDERDMPGDYDA